MRRVFSVLSLLALAATGPALAQDVDPVGSFEFNTTVEGQAISGTMQLAGSDGDWTGTILAEGQPEIPIHTVTVDGSNMTMTAEIPDAGELLIELMFDGDEFSGTWSLGFDGAELTGRRVST